MSLIDFASFSSRYPDLAAVWQAWSRADKPHRHYLDFRDVLRRGSGLDPKDVLRASNILLDSGAVEQVYKVVDPHSETLVGPDLDDPLKVPPTVAGAFAETIRTDETDIVPVLKKVQA
ncbi:MAG TPA: hypothetical protein VK176_13040 [Phycisphaerales bacterium]|nr:hypothetical protein [Phycisphaerales bacterium]